MKKWLKILSLNCIFILSSCSGPVDKKVNEANTNKITNNESYLNINENDFIKTSKNAISTFSLDTNTAGYSNIRRMIQNNLDVPKNAVKIEEMLNYFHYDYEAPDENPLAIYTEVSKCPWSQNHYLASIAVKAKEIQKEELPPSNIVLLLDVSGSMYSKNKLPLMQSSFKILVENLQPNDTISIVTYAGNDAVVLDGEKAFNQKKIVTIMEDLEAKGSTAGSKGLETAYKLAEKHFIKNGNNRIILATDGDFNVGISSNKELERFISLKKESGVFLSIVGLGYGNLKDDKLERLANCGNGNYYYIDSLLEAKKVFMEEIGGTLLTVAKDVKAQVEFDEEMVDSYRLLGYENKLLSSEDFDDDKVDAGEIGAGHTTIAMYELILHENALSQDKHFFNAKLRYKEPNETVSHLISKLANNGESIELPSDDFTFASLVVETALLLKDSRYKGEASYSNVLARMEKVDLKQDPYKLEFMELVQKLKNK